MKFIKIFLSIALMIFFSGFFFGIVQANSTSGSVTVNVSSPTCSVTTDSNYNKAPCSGVCSNNGKNYPTCTPPTVDSCGPSSGSTPQNPQPTGSDACSAGTFASSPADTAFAWNWSCGTVTSCSAPKYGCTVKNDINYNATGPANDWGCANKCSIKSDSNYNTAPCSGLCANGGKDYSTCTPPTTDSCGYDSGATPQLTEPTGVAACAFGSKLSSPSDTSDVWNWSCGTTATSCSAPKYGCNVTNDINYNATGPDNNWACANKCSIKTDTNYNTAPCSGISTTTGTCFDGIKNQNETGVDTGGVCDTTSPTTTGTKVDGGWSWWTGGSSACPASGTLTRTCTNPSPENGGSQCLTEAGKYALTESKPYNNDQCPKFNSGEDLYAIYPISQNVKLSSGVKIPYNAKAKIVWTPENVNSCSCSWSDVSTSGSCGSSNGAGSYLTPSLKRDTKYTIQCRSLYGAFVEASVSVPVDKINTGYQEN